ncbi:MAG TPA: hypothetical protein VGQ76_08480 [Thermoanaerobaculia bacterium]|jgi:hypothetical protein|nr:hypothetical protein [Thermoanaerobaculia bacterium]
MNRNYSRIAALALFVYLTVSPAATAAPRRDQARVSNPGDQVVRVVKKLKNFFRGVTTQDEHPVPPVPNPPKP